MSILRSGLVYKSPSVVAPDPSSYTRTAQTSTHNSGRKPKRSYSVRNILTPETRVIPYLIAMNWFATASPFEIDNMENIDVSRPRVSLMPNASCSTQIQLSSVDQLYDELFASDTSMSLQWYAGESSSSSRLFLEDLYQQPTGPIEDPNPYSPVARSSALPEDLPSQPQLSTTTSEHHLLLPSPTGSEDVPQLCISPSEIMAPIPTPSPAATRPQPPTPPPIAAIPDLVIYTTQNVSDTDSDAGSLFSDTLSSTGGDGDTNNNGESRGGATEAALVDHQWDSDQDAEGEPDELEASGDEKCEIPVKDTVGAPSIINEPTVMPTLHADDVKSEVDDTLSDADADCETDPDAEPQDLPRPAIAIAQDQENLKRKRAHEDDDSDDDDDDGTPPPAQRLRLGYKSLPRLQLKQRRPTEDDDEYVPSGASSVCDSDDEREDVWPVPGPSTSTQRQQSRKRKRPTEDPEDEDDDYDADAESSAHTQQCLPRKTRRLSANRNTGRKRRVFRCDSQVRLPDGTSRVCDEPFGRESDVRRHQESKHSDRAYKCGLCQCVLSRKDAVVRHHRMKHGDSNVGPIAEEVAKPDPYEPRTGHRRKKARGAGSTSGKRTRRKVGGEGYLAPAHASDSEYGSTPESED